MACNRVYRNKDDEKVEETVYMKCVAWGRLSELVLSMCCKGTTVLVEGRLETREFEGDDGETKKYVNIIARDVRFIDGLRESADREPHTGGKSLSVKGMDLPPGTNQATVDALNVLLSSK